MKKILLRLFVIFMFIFIINNISAQTIYVSDGAQGVNPNCLAPNYNQINDAIAYVQNNSINNAQIIVCEGTYNEDLFIMGNNFTLIGENENVYIEGFGFNSSLIPIFNSSNITIKNFNLRTPALSAITIHQSSNINLENIEVHGIEGIHAEGGNVIGININKSNNINLEGNITIRDITSERSIVGLLIFESNVNINTQKLRIINLITIGINPNLKAYGIDIKQQSNVSLNSQDKIIINNLDTEQPIGIIVNNSEITETTAQDLIIQEIKGNQRSVGIELSNNAVYNQHINSEYAFLEIEDRTDGAYGIYAYKSKPDFKGKLFFENIAGDGKTISLYVEECNIFTIGEINLKNNETQEMAYNVFFKKSRGDINKLRDNEKINISDSFISVGVYDNSYLILKDFKTMNGLSIPLGIDISNSIINVLDSDLSNLTKQARFHNAVVFIYNTSNIDVQKLTYINSTLNDINIYKRLVPDYKYIANNNDTKKINNITKLYYEVKGSNTPYQITEDLENIDLLFYKGISTLNNQPEIFTYNDYLISIISSRINEKYISVKLNNSDPEQKILLFEEIPEIFIQQEAVSNDNQLTIVDHFFVEKINCGTQEMKISFACYDIQKSKELFGQSYKLKFKIPLTWIEANDLNINQVFMFKKFTDKFAKINTMLREQEGGYQAYLSTMNSFSEFQIAGDKEDTHENFNKSSGGTIISPNIDKNTSENNDSSSQPKSNGLENEEDVNGSDRIYSCDLICPEGTFLNSLTCECLNLEDYQRLRCDKICDPGYTLDGATCSCVPIVLSGITAGNKSVNLISIFLIILLLVIIVLLVLFFLKKKKEKNNKKQNRKSKKKQNKKSKKKQNK